MKKIAYFIALLFVLSACIGNNKSEVERLKAENDSLHNAKMMLEEEVNDYFSVLSDVQQNIEKIKTTQNVISVQPLRENTPQDVRNKVMQDMAYLNEMIKNNQTELDNLRSRLKKSTFKLSDVEKTLAQLTKQLEIEATKVARLQAVILQKDSLISRLDNKVDSLGKNIDNLNQQNEEKKDVIKSQDQQLHSAWYAIGSKKELRDNKITTSEGLFSAQKVLQSDFNKNYFVKIDARETRTIPLYTSSKVKILTSHPKTSYHLEEENDSFMLVITNPSDFWSVSKYLVVEVQ